MYNGIGLRTARGSGTNGYVQANRAFIPLKSYKQQVVNYKDAFQEPPPKLRPINKEILLHEKKRDIERQLLEWRIELEERNTPNEEIEERITKRRKLLLDRLEREMNDTARVESEYQRDLAKREERRQFFNSKKREGHLIAEAQLRKNERAMKALGIRKDFVSGEAFDQELQEKKRLERIAEYEKKRNKKRKDRDDSSGSSSESDEEGSPKRIKKDSKNDKSPEEKSKDKSPEEKSKEKSPDKSSDSRDEKRYRRDDRDDYRRSRYRYDRYRDDYYRRRDDRRRSDRRSRSPYRERSSRYRRRDSPERRHDSRSPSPRREKRHDSRSPSPRREKRHDSRSPSPRKERRRSSSRDSRSSTSSFSSSPGSVD